MNYYSKPTAGHETHGQGVIIDGDAGRTVALVYDSAKDAPGIVRAVNSFEAMREALRQAVQAIPTTHGAFETCRAALLLADGEA